MFDFLFDFLPCVIPIDVIFGLGGGVARRAPLLSGPRAAWSPRPVDLQLFNLRLVPGHVSGGRSSGLDSESARNRAESEYFLGGGRVVRLCPGQCASEEILANVLPTTLSERTLAPMDCRKQDFDCSNRSQAWSATHRRPVQWCPSRASPSAANPAVGHI